MVVLAKGLRMVVRTPSDDVRPQEETLMTPPTSTVLVSETPAMSGRPPYQLDVGQSTLTVAYLQSGRSSYGTAPKQGGPLTLIPGTMDTGLSMALLRAGRCQTLWHTRNRSVEVAWRLDPP
jgi:hypothetical protein